MTLMPKRTKYRKMQKGSCSGLGKGAVDHWVAVVRPGKVLFEVGNVPKEMAQNALRRAAAKLPLKTRFVERVERVG